MKTPVMTREDDCRNLMEGYFFVAVLSSNGKDLDIRIPEDIVPCMTEELVEKATFCFVTPSTEFAPTSGSSETR